MPVCGLSLNITNLRSEFISKIATLIALSGLVGLPAGAISIQAILNTAVLSVKGSLASLLPDIPFADELISLRDQLDEFASGLATDIEGLVGDFGDIINLDGLANTDLANLVKSAIALGTSFDPCSLVSGVPNVVRDAAGNLISLPDAPNIGATDFKNMFGEVLEMQTYVSDFSAGIKDNVSDVSSLISDVNQMASLADINSIRNTFETNVSGAISSMGLSLKKLPSGEMVLQSQMEYLTEQISFYKHMQEG